MSTLRQSVDDYLQVWRALGYKLTIHGRVLPQFVDRHAGVPVAAQIAVLGAIHTANCAVAYLGLGTLARNALVRRPSAAYAVTRISGVAMIVLGGLLVLERALGWG